VGKAPLMKNPERKKFPFMVSGNGLSDQGYQR
jgi:hypothetical protein